MKNILALFEQLILAILTFLKDKIYSISTTIEEEEINEVEETKTDQDFKLIRDVLPKSRSGRRVMVGVTGGPETTDHYPTIRVASHPRLQRLYYLQDKDQPKGTYPRDVEFKKVPEEDGVEKWFAYSNFDRFQKVARVLNADLQPAKPMISTENIVAPGGWKKFPNKNWSFADWGSKDKVKEWSFAFIDRMNRVFGPGQWIWQLSSEPWLTDWHPVRDAYMDVYISLPVDQRPVLAWPALPIGQGDANEEGTNKYYPEKLTDYVPAKYRKYISIICIHAYALDNRNEFVDNHDIVLDVVNRGVAFTREYLPHAKVRITEMGHPAYTKKGEDKIEIQQKQYTHIKSVLDKLEAIPEVEAAYLYNYVENQSDDVFQPCFLASKTNLPKISYELVDQVEVGG